MTLANATDAFRQSQRSRPDGKQVTAALLTLEKQAKQSKQSIPLESLLGTWQLCFSAGKKAKFQSGEPVGGGFYMPKLAIARIAFIYDTVPDHELRIANELHAGPLTIRFTGPARYPDQKNLLTFDFTHLQVSCFGLTLYQGAVGNKRTDSSFQETAIAKLPFFAFFAATEDYIAARGRGGGLAIWIKPEN